MTVKELLDHLKNMPEEAVVILSSDSEGNSHSPLASVSDGNWRAQNSWSGDFIDHSDMPSKAEERQDFQKAVLLWPTK